MKKKKFFDNNIEKTIEYYIEDNNTLYLIENKDKIKYLKSSIFFFKSKKGIPLKNANILKEVSEKFLLNNNTLEVIDFYSYFIIFK
jgi:hypothetical protein